MVSKSPDVNHLLDPQGDMMNAASAAGEAVATQIAAVANAKRDSAKKAQEQAVKDGNLDLAAEYGAEAAKWDEGGTYRVAASGANDVCCSLLSDHREASELENTRRQARLRSVFRDFGTGAAGLYGALAWKTATCAKNAKQFRENIERSWMFRFCV